MNFEAMLRTSNKLVLIIPDSGIKFTERFIRIKLYRVLV